MVKDAKKAKIQGGIDNKHLCLFCIFTFFKDAVFFLADVLTKKDKGFYCKYPLSFLILKQKSYFTQNCLRLRLRFHKHRKRSEVW